MSNAEPQATDILYPLSAFAPVNSEEMTSARFLEADELPDPYRTLLAHDRDMTGTLETFFRQPMDLKVYHKKLDGDALYRCVTLLGAEDKSPAEFGAIRIDLSCFDDQARALVEAGKVPLGRVLREHGVAYVSNPSAYLCVSPDAMLCEALHVSQGPLYGRKNELTTPGNRAIAQIIEILPTLEDSTRPD